MFRIERYKWHIATNCNGSEVTYLSDEIQPTQQETRINSSLLRGAVRRGNSDSWKQHSRNVKVYEEVQS